MDLVGGVHRFRESITILVITCTKNKNINNINIKRTNTNFMWLVAVFKKKNLPVIKGCGLDLRAWGESVWIRNLWDGKGESGRSKEEIGKFRV